MATPASASNPSILRRYAESPRAQRRALVGGIAVLAVGAAVFVFMVFRNTGHPLPVNAGSQPASVAVQERTVALDPSVIGVAKEFIATAVARKNLGRAYDIVGSELRGGMSRSQFEKGNIPVVPYPADDVGQLAYKVDYSYPTQARIEITLTPKAGSVGIKRLPFFIGFKKVGSGADARWVVNYWEPHYHPPVPVAQ